MKPTMRDVAQESGVSQTTVSFVLNGKNLDRIPEETQKRVLTAAKELNYRIQAMGLSLVTGKTQTIGLLYDETYEYLIHDGFCSMIFLGIQDALKKINFRLSFATVNEKEQDTPMMIETHSVDGVIFLAAKSERIIQKLIDYKIPTILIDPVRTHPRIKEIKINNLDGTLHAMEYLYHSGHRKIGCISAKYETIQDEPVSFKERRTAYETFMTQTGILLTTELIRIATIHYQGMNPNNDPVFQAGYESMIGLLNLDQPPTAVFAVNDRLAMGALAAARDLNVNVPEQISIIGFDDITESSRSVPPLTTVSVPKQQMGIIAVQELLALITHEDGDIEQTEPIKTIFIIRQSTVSIPINPVLPGGNSMG